MSLKYPHHSILREAPGQRLSREKVISQGSRLETTLKNEERAV